MQPPSFEDFIKRQFSATSSTEKKAFDKLSLASCPTPGCGSHALMLKYDDGAFSGFTCANGCVFSAQRNVFTGEIMYFELEDGAISPPKQTTARMRVPITQEPYTDFF